MNRTINEKKAWKGISISSVLITISMIGTVFLIKYNWAIIFYLILASSIFWFGYSCYSLGWEYKRISQTHSKEKSK